MTMLQLYRGDCLDIMPTLTASSVDLILADLPYGTTACKWDTVIPFPPLWAEYKRLIKPRGAVVLFGSQPFTALLVASNLDWFRYCWEWDKGRGFNPQLANVQPLKSHEDIAVFGSGAVNYNPQKTRLPKPDKRSRTNEGANRRGGEGLNVFASPRLKNTVYTDRYPVSVLRFAPVPQTKRTHPNEKPVALLEYLVRTYTNAGDSVLDNTMGSGSTGVAAVNTGRSFTGIEKRADYFAIAERRITDAQAQLSLLPEVQV